MKIRELRQQPVRTFLIHSRNEEFKTFLTDGQALHLMRAKQEHLNSFGQDLLNTALTDRRGLSERQLPWFHKLALDLLPPAARPDYVPAPGAVQPLRIDLGVIRAMMDRAGTKLLRPKIKFVLEQGTIMVARAGKQSRTPGAIMVTDGRRFGENTFYGRVHNDGTWEAARTGCPAWVLEVLQGLAGNPAGFAAIYGKRTGQCCFCGLGLTDGRSVAVGYGPICASNYGLPWGDQNVNDAPAEVVEVATVAAEVTEAREEAVASLPAPEPVPAVEDHSEPWRRAKVATLGEVAPWLR